MTASPPAAPGMPSAESIEDEIRPMSSEGADLTECVDRILSLIRQAFEAKDAEAQHWQTRATVYKRLMTDAQRGKEAAEAKLAQAVEALEDAALFMDGDLSGTEQRVRIVTACRTASAMGEKT